MVLILNMVGTGSLILLLTFLLVAVLIIRMANKNTKPKRMDLERIEHKLDTIIKNQKDQR